MGFCHPDLPAKRFPRENPIWPHRPTDLPCRIFVGNVEPRTGALRFGCRLPRCEISGLTLQRRFEGFPFFESFEAAFTVGLVGLMVAPCMILDQYQNVAELAFGLRKTAFH